MGIYISNLKIPKDEYLPINIYPDGRVACRFDANCANAIELPPHGRLGDLDRLEQMFVDIDDAPYSGFDGTEPFYSAEDAARIIRLAPTIIPAEEEMK